MMKNIKYLFKNKLIGVLLLFFVFVLLFLIIEILMEVIFGKLQNAIDLSKIFGYILAPGTIIFTVYQYFDQKKENSKREYDRVMFELSVHSNLSGIIIVNRKKFVNIYIKKLFDIVYYVSRNEFDDADDDVLGKMILDLRNLKNEYSCWLSNKQIEKIKYIERKLLKIEGSLLDIKEMEKKLMKNVTVDVHEYKSQLDRHYEYLEEIFNETKLNQIVEILRDIFGINEISDLHEYMFKSASEYTKR